MTDAATTNTTGNPQASNLQVVRETVESLAVAFILALLFKAFIAEAFVIPTGSMAPTLMGAHKDIQCPDCGYQYQCGASNEFSDVGARSDQFVVGTVCPLTRKPHVANPYQDSNAATFSGDRILVSKLAYVFSKPQRWDVIVFKYIEGARLNYIKRCIGLPTETIRIREGDIFIQRNEASAADTSNSKPTGPGRSFQIARKPPHVMNAMLQLVSDSNYVSKSLVKAGMPSAWQPFPSTQSTWQVKQSESNWSASVTGVPAGETQWMRYYHRIVDPLAWEHLEKTGSLPVTVSPQSSRLITDFTGYNAGYSSNIKFAPQNFQADAESSIRTTNKRGYAKYSPRPIENDGIHWVGDLATEFDVKIEPGTQSMTLMIVEAGVEHACRFDLKTGDASATVLVDGKSVEAFEEGASLSREAKAATKVRAGGRYTIRFANVDDTLVLWIDGRPVSWNPSGNLQTSNYLPLSERKPKTTVANPLDAAPIAIGVDGGGAEVTRARVFRDIYYIAQGGRHQELYDYPEVIGALRQSSTIENNERYAQENHGIKFSELSEKMSLEGIYRNAIMSNPTQWAKSAMFDRRQTVDFTLKDDWYFPMGDNSSASSDARSWGHTPERLMIGRAVMVFWPHYWNAPIPFLPNVQRMGLIR